MKKSKKKGFIDASNEVLKNYKYRIILMLATLLMFLLYVFIPIYLTPGNDLKFFIEITPWWGFVLLLILSILMGLLISMQFYVFRNSRNLCVKESTSGFIAWISSLISGLFTSATCASCLSVLFAFLGSSGIMFLLKYRWYFTVLGFILVLVSLHLTAMRINDYCKTCSISKK